MTEQDAWNAISYAIGPWFDLVSAFVWGFIVVRLFAIVAGLFRLRWRP